MPTDITWLTDVWLELESDPRLFILLLKNFGVKSVQDEEIYDLYKVLEGPVYRFILLFRWTEERRARRKVVETAAEIFVKDEEKVNSIFFAQQVVPNSCTTHALLSQLLNCGNLWAIGNTPELTCDHNLHAMSQAKRRLDKSSGINTGRFTGEAFHFVSFVPIDGHILIFELDGLVPFPMNHGPWKEGEEWTDKFRITMEERLGISTGEQDIRFILMAIVPDRRIAITHKLKMLRTNIAIVTAALEKLINDKSPHLTSLTRNDVKKEANYEMEDAKKTIKISNVVEEGDIKQEYGLQRPKTKGSSIFYRNYRFTQIQSLNRPQLNRLMKPYQMLQLHRRNIY